MAPPGPLLGRVTMEVKGGHNHPTLPIFVPDNKTYFIFINLVLIGKKSTDNKVKGNMFIISDAQGNAHPMSYAFMGFCIDYVESSYCNLMEVVGTQPITMPPIPGTGHRAES